MLEIPHDPILSLSQAHAFEQEYFNGDEALQWDAMTRAGEAVADSALRDMRELRTIPHRPKLMVLVGKGTMVQMPSLQPGDFYAPSPLPARQSGMDSDGGVPSHDPACL